MDEHDHGTRGERLQSPHLDEELRTDELVRTTFASRSDADDPSPRGGSLWRGPGNRGGRRRPVPKSIKWAAAGLIVLFVGGFGISYYVARHAFIAAMGAKAGQLQQGIHALKDFNLNEAARQFAMAGSNGTGIESVLGPLSSLFSGGTNVVSVFGNISTQLSLLTQDLSNVQSDVWDMLAHVPIVNGASVTGAFAGASSSTSSSLALPSASSTALITDLKGIQSALATIDANSATLVNIAASLKVSLPGGGQYGIVPGAERGIVGSYLSLSAGLHATEAFLNAFIPWLADPSTTHHLLVLLENPSEMRPGGGFLGSYADVSLRGGAITGIAVHDIANVDAAFMKKIVPPVPLQLEENGWRPADGNWFFDFPTSASATIALFEGSHLYDGTAGSATPRGAVSTTFDGVIAVTPQAMADILSVVGPITVPDAALGIASPGRGTTTSTTFTADNLIPELQNIVQEGQARRGSAPKSIIGVLWKAAFARLASANATQRQDLMTLAANWIANKDVMAYFKDPAIENFILASGIGGEEFRFPSDFNGDYLAVANTDVNSDKSELYVSSTVAWTVQIGAHGTATDQVVVTRTHHGTTAPAGAWWYRTTNQDWLQVFVPGGSSLTNETGGFIKQVPAPVNYARGGWSTDPLISAMQASTTSRFAYPAVSVRDGNAGGADPGKTIYGVWDRTYAGRTSQVTLDYTHPLYTPPADGVQYEFVLERPSGATGAYTIEVDAPLGYVFAENGLASWTYNATSTPGRLVVDLTLQKL